MTVQKGNSRIGINFFLKNKKNSQDFQILRQVRTRIKNHTPISKQRLVRGDRNNLQQSGLPSRVASSVVQDYTPYNLRSGVTNILN